MTPIQRTKIYTDNVNQLNHEIKTMQDTILSILNMASKEIWEDNRVDMVIEITELIKIKRKDITRLDKMHQLDLEDFAKHHNSLKLRMQN